MIKFETLEGGKDFGKRVRIQHLRTSLMHCMTNIHQYEPD